MLNHSLDTKVLKIQYLSFFINVLSKTEGIEGIKGTNAKTSKKYNLEFSGQFLENTIFLRLV